MPFYPTFAFFEERPQAHHVADGIINALAEWFSEVIFQYQAGETSGHVQFETSEEALQFLRTQKPEISEFWLSSDLHDIRCFFKPWGGMEIELWDFDSDLYDEGEPTKKMAQEKRQIAFALHHLLVEGCGAVFSCTAAVDNKYAGANDPYDMVDLVPDALRSGNLQALIAKSGEGLNLWLAAFRTSTAVLQALNRSLQTRFDQVGEGEKSVVYEHKENRPFFLI